MSTPYVYSLQTRKELNGGLFGGESVYWTGYLTFSNDMVCQHKVRIYNKDLFTKPITMYV